MITIDCPLCDTPAAYRPETGTLDCAACAVELEVAEDEPRTALATAA
jgi:uncharacterized Zn finger protein (UPF0148 family)